MVRKHDLQESYSAARGRDAGASCLIATAALRGQELNNATIIPCLQQCSQSVHEIKDDFDINTKDLSECKKALIAQGVNDIKALALYGIPSGEREE